MMKEKRLPNPVVFFIRRKNIYECDRQSTAIADTTPIANPTAITINLRSQSGPQSLGSAE